MGTIKYLLNTWIPRAVALAAFGLIATGSASATVNATYNAASDVPVTAGSYTAAGNTVVFNLNFAPATGTDLMVVKNTGLGFIAGTFDNLTNGQPVALSYGGNTYCFVANYYGGSGNDLVLAWANSRAYAWGRNSDAQLGDNTTTNRLLPVPVTATGVLAGKTVVAIAAGGYHSLALCSDGTLAAWGRNAEGQLGQSTTTDSPVPVAVNTAAGISALFGKRVVAIAAGNWHSLALCSDGTVAAWGDNFYGELGDQTTTNRLVPVAVNTASGSALSGKTVAAIVAGGSHSLALCSDGTVAAWGYNYLGQLGSGSITASRPYGEVVPVAVNTASGSALLGKTVAAIAVGYWHSLALCSDGTVAAWGWDANGQLGDNGGSGLSPVPVAVNTAAGVSALYGKTVVAVATGGWHNLALCSDGTVATWGRNAEGQLGENTTTNRLVPVAVNTASGVSALYGKTVVAIAGGAYHSLALCSDSSMAAWGDNGYGELGDDSMTQRLVPVAVNTTPLAAGQRFAHLASSPTASHTLALVAGSPASEFTLTDAQRLANGAFQFAFTNVPGSFFSVLATTNPALPLSNWTALGDVTEVSPGQFQFTDPQAANYPQRCYRVRSGLTTGTTLPVLTGGAKLANGAFQIVFVSTPGAVCTLLATTNPLLPLSDWTVLGNATEVSPGWFQFTDPEATNSPQRFYRVRSP